MSRIVGTHAAARAIDRPTRTLRREAPNLPAAVAWKTEGGHWRFDLDNLRAFIAARRESMAANGQVVTVSDLIRASKRLTELIARYESREPAKPAN